MPKGKIEIHTDVLSTWDALSDAEWGRLVKAMLTYRLTGQVEQLLGAERIMFPGERVKIDRQLETEEKRKAGTRERVTRYRALQSVTERYTPSPSSPSSSSPPSSPPIPPVITPVSLSPVPTSPPKEKPPKGGKKKAPAPPTLGGAKPPAFEQVLEVAKLRGCPECAKPFFDYYAAAGWRDSEGKPCAWNWQQKLIAWQMRAQERKKPDPKQKQPDPNDWKEFSL